MPGDAEPLSKAIGANVRRLRLEHGHSQDQLASQLRGCGLEMSRSAVAALERGARQLGIDDFALLCLALRCEPDDLLAGDQNIQLSPTASGSLKDLRSIIKGAMGEMSFTAVDRPEAREIKELFSKDLSEIFATNRDVWERLMPGASIGAAVDAEESAKGETETRVARSLSVPAWHVAVAAFGLWGHSLTDERERRVTELLSPSTPANSARTIRGHVTHELVTEIRHRLEEVKA